MRSFGSARRVVALDIGSHSVKLVAVRHSPAGPRLEAVARATMPPDVMHGHVVRNPERVGAVIRALLRRAGRRGGTVRTAIPASAVMMRRLTVRGSTKAQRDAEVAREVAAHIPARLEQAVIDYQVLGPSAVDGGAPVLVVAARRELVQSYSAAVRAGGVEPGGLDVDVFALARLVRADVPDGDAALLVHAGARHARVTRVGRDGPAWVGDVPADGGVAPEALAHAVRHALDLLAPDDATAPPSRVLLSGGGAAAAGLATAFAATFACPVAVVDPLASMAVRRRGRCEPAGPAFAVAAGLALQAPGGRA